MSSAVFVLGSTEAVVDEAQEMTVRSTLEPVRPDPDEAEAQSAPEWNQLETDDSPHLTGLSRRAKGADTTDSVQYVPWWKNILPFAQKGIDEVNERQADMGTAAAREVAGEQGHGTMQIEESIDPIIRPGAAFGNDYFAVMPQAVQEGMGKYMTPVDNDTWTHAVAQSRGVTGSQEATRSTLYRNFMAGR